VVFLRFGYSCYRDITITDCFYFKDTTTSSDFVEIAIEGLKKKKYVGGCPSGTPFGETNEI
jgi:hypothetical protein